MDVILYNPLSRNSRGNLETHRLVLYYRKKHLPFRLKSILKIDDMVEYLEEKSHYDRVILLGGDGTINRFINSTIDYKIQQTIFLKKNGTGNDFLRTLKQQDSLPQTIMKATLNNKHKTHFINGAGMGIDGFVTSLMEDSKRKGKLKYMANTLRALIQYNPSSLTVTLDDTVYEFNKAYLITMQNGKYFGGGMKITPDASLSNEELDIVVVHTASRWILILIFFTIYLGLHLHFKRYVFHKKAKKIKATYNSIQVAQTDGETIHDITSLEVESSKKSIYLRHFKK